MDEIGELIERLQSAQAQAREENSLMYVAKRVSREGTGLWAVIHPDNIDDEEIHDDTRALVTFYPNGTIAIVLKEAA